MTSPAPLRLRPPRHRVDPRARWWWLVRAVLTSVPPVTVLALLTAFIPPTRWLFGALLAIAVVFALVLVAVMPWWRYRVHRWETTDDAVYAASGWFYQHWRVAPMSRIQTVDRVRGPLQQLFGLSGVTVTTASAHGAVHIEGLADDVATALVAQLTETTQATPGDAT